MNVSLILHWKISHFLNIIELEDSQNLCVRYRKIASSVRGLSGQWLTCDINMLSKTNCLLAGLPSFTELSKVIKKPRSGLILHNYQVNVPIKARYIGNVREGIVEYLNSKLLVYDDKLEGQPLAYDPDFTILDEFGRIQYSDPRPHYRVAISLILLHIKVGVKLKGTVKLVEKKHCCALIHNCVHASVYFPESHSHYAFCGLFSEQKIRFRVVELTLHNCTLSVYAVLTTRYITLYGRPFEPYFESFPSQNGIESEQTQPQKRAISSEGHSKIKKY